jgi:hypothetical protein
MNEDIVKRLRSAESYDYGSSSVIVGWLNDDPTDDAADEIESLRAHVAKLEGLLSLLSADADRYDPPEGDDDHLAWDTRLTIGHLRKARAALKANP